jgi:hypothetical protein
MNKDTENNTPPQKKKKTHKLNCRNHTVFMMHLKCDSRPMPMHQSVQNFDTTYCYNTFCQAFRNILDWNLQYSELTRREQRINLYQEETVITKLELNG